MFAAAAAARPLRPRGREFAARTRRDAAMPRCRCTFAARAEYTQADCHFYLD
jgi:hypothetical protein